MDIGEDVIWAELASASYGTSQIRLRPERDYG